MRILHTADLHMDSPFEALSSEKASVKRAGQRSMLGRIAEIANSESVDLVLLAGDLLDSENSYYETGEELLRSLRRIDAPVIISPGNHDRYCRMSPYSRLELPYNVHVFTRSRIEMFDFSEYGFMVYGAAFTDSACTPLMEGFRAERKHGLVNIMCIHGDTENRNSKYNPISREQIADSGLDYLALGHIHKASGLLKEGRTFYSYSGCPEGRGFDETGEKTVNIIDINGNACTLRTCAVSSGRYDILNVNVSGSDPLVACRMAIPDNALKNVCRIVLKGRTDSPPDMRTLKNALSGLFFELQLRDETRPCQSIWEQAGDDSLRGIFLSKLKALYDAAETPEQKLLAENAAKWGLAALNNGEELSAYED